jgi:hypothetical protein
VDIWANTRLLLSTLRHSPNNTATEGVVLAVLCEVLAVLCEVLAVLCEVLAVVVVVGNYPKAKSFVIKVILQMTLNFKINQLI